ncbi:hypothetical protein [Microbulbifer sp. SAOS-129_SWC]|uniref:hypothetical protein n=1 Tax=Microbulbifer sp. SAOS-129_SWC TaxID=3145235 RepID=UPI00321667C1
MSVVTSAIWGGASGLLGVLFYWRRERELDDFGKPCLRFCGPRFGIPLVGVFFLLAGLNNLGDPFYLRHPENFVVMFGFSLFAFVGSVYFVFYRVSVRNGVVERHAWPLSVTRYSLQELESVDEHGDNVSLRFTGGRAYKISPLLSGRSAFIKYVRAQMRG